MSESSARVIGIIKVVDELTQNLLLAIANRNLERIEAMIKLRQEQIVSLLQELASEETHGLIHQHISRFRAQDAEIMRAFKDEQGLVKTALSQFNRLKKYNE